MIDDIGPRHVLQTTSNPLVNAPRIRRSKNGFRASMVLCPRVPGLHIAKSCSGSPHLLVTRRESVPAGKGCSD